ncbi:DUF3006 family protein [Solibacillus sp. A46]|uniref:DUF3006 family protein n=1 Tax=Solibacillus faecavium TaxID=2762221 RepID=A0ABR8XYP8_9BACL|nr:DUF3006 family protein [Solibacillus faecavium]MBD8037063.1 DUF3006 family protein [Solibacillus faecavium]
MKYTLDRIENDLYVFVEKGNEENQVEISNKFVPDGILEGDIVEIKLEDELYTLTKLDNEKEIRKSDVQSLIDKLKNKK